MENKKVIYAEDLMIAIRDDLSINSSSFAAVVRHINAAPAVIVESTPALSNINEATMGAIEKIGAITHGVGGNE